MRVSEIRVNQIRVNQGLDVYIKGLLILPFWIIFFKSLLRSLTMEIVTHLGKQQFWSLFLNE